jgi:3-methyladenine DNA glycosylase AlkD
MIATLRAARRTHIGRSPDLAAVAHPRFPVVLAIEIEALPDQSVESVRRVRRAWSARLRSAPADQVVALAEALLPRHRWVAYELVYNHPGALAALDLRLVERLGRGIDSWGAVDAFGRYISGPAWQRDQIPDEAVHGWAASPDRWWRRAALVSTVPLNLRAAGGTGDTARTLAVCERLAADRDDMVVKALSWALRELIVHDPEAVREFLARHDLAARVRREVANKLQTGLKQPRGRPAP